MAKRIMEEDADTSLHCVIIGRGECGKTSLIKRYMTNEFDSKIPVSATPVRHETITFKDGKKVFSVRLWDTSGQENFCSFRNLAIPMADYIIICYSVVDFKSFTDITEAIIPVIKDKSKEGVKLILVGTKIDLRKDDDKTYEEGRFLAEKLNAIGFYECSALTGQGVELIFDSLRLDIMNTFKEEVGFFEKIFCCSF